MSLESVLSRVAELNSALAPRPLQTSAPPAAGGGPGFANALQGAMAPGGPASVAPSGGSAAARIVQLAQGEVGQAEQPPGSNNSARIAQYRAATAGAPGPGPWCAYFTSWAAREAGVPVGPNGSGFGSVDALYAWAQSAGKAIPASSGTPQPGDLIVWDEHIGIVESVRPDGTIETIEGNSSDRVSRRTHQPGDAIGYVRLG